MMIMKRHNCIKNSSHNVTKRLLSLRQSYHSSASSPFSNSSCCSPLPRSPCHNMVRIKNHFSPKWSTTISHHQQQQLQQQKRFYFFNCHFSHHHHYHQQLLSPSSHNPSSHNYYYYHYHHHYYYYSNYTTNQQQQQQRNHYSTTTTTSNNDNNNNNNHLTSLNQGVETIYNGNKALKSDAEGTTTTTTTTKKTSPITKISGTEFNILMVNDVYELVPDYQGLGGLAELSTIIKQERASIERKHANNPAHCIVTLNGDFLSASQLAFRYQGSHMIDILNTMPLQYVVPGNHEFDFGSTVLEKRIRESNFKWICSNIYYRNSDKILNGTLPKTVLTVPCDTGEKDEVKIGIFGVCTPATKNLSQPGDEIEFRDIIDSSRKMVRELREEDGCDVVIALTHLSIADDKRLARTVKGIDVELGGHDHNVITNQQSGVFIHKAGVNAQYLANVKLIIEKTTTYAFGKEFKKMRVFPEWKMIMNRGYTPDKPVKAVVDLYQSKLPKDYDDIIGITETKIDSYSESVRSKETTMGNLIADVLKEAFCADLAIINGGSIRGDRTYDAGYEITRGDIYKEFPFPSGVSLQCIKGRHLIEALEQGVSKAELNLGAFPHLSKGCELVFDILERPLERIKKFELHGEPIDPDRVYNICSTNYMLGGGDGYTSLKHHATIVNHENNNRTISDLVIEYIEKKRIVSSRKEGRIYLYGYK